MRGRLPPPLRFTLPLLLIASSVVVAGFAWRVNYLIIQKRFNTEAIDHLLNRATQLQVTLEELLKREDVPAAQAILTSYGSELDLAAVLLVDDRDRVLLSTRVALLGQESGVALARTSAVEAAVLKRELTRARGAGRAITYFSADHEYLFGLQPVLLGAEAGELRPRRVGVLVIQVGLRYSRNAGLRQVERGIAVFTLFSLALATLLWLALRRLLTQRMEILLATAQRVGAEDLEARSTLSGSDELAELSRALDEMAAQLSRSKNERITTEARNLRLGRVLNDTSDEIYIFDASTLRFLEVNLGARTNLCYSEEDLRGMTPLDLKPEFTAESFRRMLEPLLRGEIEHQIFLTDHRRKDGTLYPVEVHLSYAASERPPAFVAVIRDISAGKAAEQARLEAIDRWKTLASFAPVGIFEADAEGNCFFVNEAWCRLTGLLPGEAQGTGWGQAIHPGDRERVFADWEVLVRDSTPFDSEYRYLRPDGTIVRVHGLAHPLTRDGKTIGFVGTATDITELREALDSLGRAEARYRSMIRNAAYGIYRSTAAGRFEVVNPALVEMLGYPSAEQLMQVDLARDLYADPAARSRLVEQFQHHRKVDSVETTWKRFDGALIDVRISSRPIFDADGALEGFENIVENVTERRGLERRLQQSEKMEAIGQLAGGVAHDFNNLLMVISGFTEVLREELGADDPRSTYLAEILTATQRASELTARLLAFGRRELAQPRIVDLPKTVNDSLSMLRRLIGAQVELASSIPPERLTVLADPGQIAQVLINLVVNARDSMPGGGTISVEVATASLAPDDVQGSDLCASGPHVVLRVRDQGLGMDKNVRERIFEPFFTTKKPGKGTGLGLATVYAIARQHRALIRVESEPGKGSVFEVFFPAVEDLESTPPEALEFARSRAGETVLLVEDAPGTRRVVSLMLKRAGYRVLEAATPREALDLCRQSGAEIDLMVSDIVMPELSGPELYSRTRALLPSLPVLFMTGYAAGELDGSISLPPGTPILQKPFDIVTFSHSVRRAIDG